MRKGCAILLLCVSMTGCAGPKDPVFGDDRVVQKRGPKAILPYDDRDNVLETVGKTFVNVPVWTLEGVAFMAVFGAYLCGMAGYTPNIR